MGDKLKYGYARVSSDTQDYAAQVEALKASGCERIYSEKASGKSTNGRPELAKLMKALLPDDTVAVTKLDRIARSSRDLQNIIHELKERGCGFVSLGDSSCDTTSDVGRLVLAIMGGIAEFERELPALSASPRPSKHEPQQAQGVRPHQPASLSSAGHCVCPVTPSANQVTRCNDRACKRFVGSLAAY